MEPPPFRMSVTPPDGASMSRDRRFALSLRAARLRERLAAANCTVFNSEFRAYAKQLNARDLALPTKDQIPEILVLGQ
jgi:hypothetical protein